MTTAFYILFVISCIVLIVAVLLQPGKADAGALFSSSVSSTAFGPRGTQTLLAKITIAAAALFMLIAIALSLPAITGQRSVLQSVGEEEPAATPQASPATSPAASPAASPATEGAANTSAPAAPAASPASSPSTGASPAPSK
ncbi:MAG TPA: preprotein translocase subunit SecG [Pyrinomonadaceae bacterium]|nr:preprotein translocase subunit SecG [Pyrinomonadaceae bacterium]